MREIRSPVKVCGSKGCVGTRALVDTGATVTMVSIAAAERAGLRDTGERRSAQTVGGRIRTRVYEGTVCMDRCGCRKQRVTVAENDRALGDDHVLLGQDFLSAMRAKIETHLGRIRCGRKGCKPPRKLRRRSG